jgi:hypothetical protein
VMEEFANTHTPESLRQLHTWPFLLLLSRHWPIDFFVSSHSLEKEVPRTHICNPRSSSSFYSSSGLLVVVIDQHLCILFGINFFSLSSGCCCGCSFLFLLQLLFPYWLTSFPLGLSNSPG